MDALQNGETPGHEQPTPTKESVEREKISRIIGRHISIEERRARFLHAAEAALRKYAASRLGVTAEEVIDWLDTWGGDTETEAPSCHR